MGHYRMGRIFAVLTLILAVFPAFVSAMTWYVDPVNGSDLYTGDNPFARPEFGIGPKRTLEGVVGVTNDYDMVVLLDGVYSGPSNGHPAIFDEIDWKHLYVCSANGPENCTIQIETWVILDNSLPSYLDTVFDGITFTSTWESDSAYIRIEHGGRIRFKDCVFTEFRLSEACAAIIFLYDGWSVFENCTFTNNYTAGILHCKVNSTIELDTCSFTDNNCSLRNPGTRGLVHVNESSINMLDCSFANNFSDSTISAIYVHNCAALLVHRCVIEDNAGAGGPFGFGYAGIWADGGAQVTLSETRIENLSCDYPALPAAGLFAMQSGSITVWDSQFNNNTAGIAIHANNDIPAGINIDRCQFIGNRAPDNNGESYPSAGIFIGAGADIIDVRECTFKSNQSGICQVGIWREDGRVQIDNCLFTDHQGPTGVIELSKPHTGCHQINNCTLADNYTFTLRAENTCVRNSILRSPAAPWNLGGLQFDHCNVEHWTGPGVGNIDVDPLFVDPGYYHLDPQQRILGTDYHLKSTAGRWDPVQDMWVVDDVDSPCIDAGDPADVPFFEPTGSGGRVNMGAYGNTWQASMTDVCFGSGWRGSGMMFSDINNDCVVNLADYAVMASEWLDSTLADLPILY